MQERYVLGLLEDVKMIVEDQGRCFNSLSV